MILCGKALMTEHLVLAVNGTNHHFNHLHSRSAKYTRRPSEDRRLIGCAGSPHILSAHVLSPHARVSSWSTTNISSLVPIEIDSWNGPRPEIVADQPIVEQTSWQVTQPICPVQELKHIQSDVG